MDFIYSPFSGVFDNNMLVLSLELRKWESKAESYLCVRANKAIPREQQRSETDAVNCNPSGLT